MNARNRHGFDEDDRSVDVVPTSPLKPESSSTAATAALHYRDSPGDSVVESLEEDDDINDTIHHPPPSHTSSDRPSASQRHDARATSPSAAPVPRPPKTARSGIRRQKSRREVSKNRSTSPKSGSRANAVSPVRNRTVALSMAASPNSDRRQQTDRYDDNNNHRHRHRRPSLQDWGSASNPSLSLSDILGGDLAAFGGRKSNRSSRTLMPRTNSYDTDNDTDTNRILPGDSMARAELHRAALHQIKSQRRERKLDIRHSLSQYLKEEEEDDEEEEHQECIVNEERQRQQPKKTINHTEKYAKREQRNHLQQHGSDGEDSMISDSEGEVSLQDHSMAKQRTSSVSHDNTTQLRSHLEANSSNGDDGDVGNQIRSQTNSISDTYSVRSKASQSDRLSVASIGNLRRKLRLSTSSATDTDNKSVASQPHRRQHSFRRRKHANAAKADDLTDATSAVPRRRSGSAGRRVARRSVRESIGSSDSTVEFDAMSAVAALENSQRRRLAESSKVPRRSQSTRRLNLSSDSVIASDTASTDDDDTDSRRHDKSTNPQDRRGRRGYRSTAPDCSKSDETPDDTGKHSKSITPRRSRSRRRRGATADKDNKPTRDAETNEPSKQSRSSSLSRRGGSRDDGRRSSSLRRRGHSRDAASTAEASRKGPSSSTKQRGKSQDAEASRSRASSTGRRTKSRDAATRSASVSKQDGSGNSVVSADMGGDRTAPVRRGRRNQRTEGENGTRKKSVGKKRTQQPDRKPHRDRSVKREKSPKRDSDDTVKKDPAKPLSSPVRRAKPKVRDAGVPPRSPKRSNTPPKVNLSNHLETTAARKHQQEEGEDVSEESSRVSFGRQLPLLQFDPTNADFVTAIHQDDAAATASDTITNYDGTKSEFQVRALAGLPTFEDQSKFHDSAQSLDLGSFNGATSSDHDTDNENGVSSNGNHGANGNAEDCVAIDVAKKPASMRKHTTVVTSVSKPASMADMTSGTGLNDYKQASGEGSQEVGSVVQMKAPTGPEHDCKRQQRHKSKLPSATASFFRRKQQRFNESFSADFGESINFLGGVFSAKKNDGDDGADDEQQKNKFGLKPRVSKTLAHRALSDDDYDEVIL